MMTSITAMARMPPRTVRMRQRIDQGAQESEAGEMNGGEPQLGHGAERVEIDMQQ